MMIMMLDFKPSDIPCVRLQDEPANGTFGVSKGQMPLWNLQ
jgi:hypothetical protein